MVSPFSMNPAGKTQNPLRGSMALRQSSTWSPHSITQPATTLGFW